MQWDTLKLDYVYIFRAEEREKGFNVHQLIEWFNLVLPHRVLMNTQEVQERFDEAGKHATMRVLKMFKSPISAFPKKWKTYRNLEKVFTVLLLLYMILRDDLVSICITLFYLCYAALFCIHVPYSFYNIVSWILYRCFAALRNRTAVIIIRFILQTSLVSQYLVDGSWRLSGMVAFPCALSSRRTASRLTTASTPRRSRSSTFWASTRRASSTVRPRCPR